MAGKKIRGITVEIGGDVSGLNKALDKTNGNIRDTQKQLKDVERLLKLDPGNVELLRQKQQLLTQAVTETKEKLDVLKKTEESLKASGVEENSAQFMAVRREIISTTDELRGLEEAMEHFGITGAQKVAAVGENIKGVGENIANAGALLTEHLTEPIVDGFTSAVKTTADFDTAMSQVAATMGKTVDEITDLRDFARDMGSKTAFSATEAAEALNYMALAGYDAQTSMEMLPNVLNLAAAGGIDLARASDMVTDAQTALGISLYDTTWLVDQMAAVSANTNTSVEQLGDAILKVGGNARGLSGDTAELTAVLGILADNGVKGAEAGTHLRNILLSLTPTTDAAAKAFEQLGLEAYDTATGELRPLDEVFGDLAKSLDGLTDEDRTRTLSNIFNKTDLASVNYLLSTSADRWDEVYLAIEDCQGAAGKMADTQLDNLNGQMTLLKSALDELSISVGDVLMPIVRDVVAWTQSTVDWLNSLDDGTKKTIVTVLGVVAAIGPLLLVGGKLLIGVGQLMTYAPMIHNALAGAAGGFSAVTGGVANLLPKIGSLFSTVWGFIAANPIVLIIAAIIALVALIATKGDEIKAILQKVDDFLQDIFAKDFTEIFGPVLGDALNAFFTNVKSIWDSLKRILDGLIDFIRGVFTGDWDRAWNGIKNIVGGVFDHMLAMAKIPLNGIIGLINGLISGINFLVRKLNSLKITPPQWVTSLSGIGSFGFRLPEIGKIPYLATGGILSAGSAIVGEAGPELLTMSAGRAVVQPLSSSNTSNHNTYMGGVSIYVYGAPGQDVDDLAEAVLEKAQQIYEKEEIALA